MLFYHPVVWWLSGQIRLEREHIADQLAVAVTDAPRPLALALAALADVQALGAAPLALAGNGGKLKTRIELLLRLQQPARRLASGVLPLVGLATSALGLVACTVVAHRGPRPAAPIVDADELPRLSYALVRGDAEPILAWGPDDEIDQVARELPRGAHDFVLVRRNGHDALVTDPAVVAPLRQAWEHAGALETEASALEGLLLAQHEGAQRLAEETSISQIEAALDANAAVGLDRAQRDLSSLERRLSELGRRQEAAYQRVERRLRDVSAATPSVRP